MKRFLLTGVVITMLWACSSATNNNPDVVSDTAMTTDTVTDTVTDTTMTTDTTPDVVSDTAMTTDTVTDTVTDTTMTTDTVTDTDTDTDSATDTATDSDTALPPISHFTSPEGIAAANGLVYVADPAAAYDADSGTMVYGQSHLVVIDAKQANFPIVADLNVDAKNLQTVITTTDRICAVASGTATYDTNSGKMVPDSPGKLYCKSTDSDPGSDPDTKIDLPLSKTNPSIGLPASIVIMGDFAYIGSGTAPVVYKVDLKNKVLVNGADKPIWLLSNAGNTTGMVKLFTDGTRVYALDFNSDSIYSIDTSNDKVKSMGQFGDDPNKMEGPIAAVFSHADSKIYAVMNMSNALWQITPKPFAAVKIGATGATPNAIADNSGTTMFIANSMDNNISRYDTTDGTITTPFANLDPGADPWNLTFLKVNNKSMLFVTAYMEKDVYVFEVGKTKANLLAKIK